MPSSPPATTELLGTPTALRRRPGRAYLTMPPTTRSVVTVANTSHPVVDCASAAHTSTAPRIRIDPGRTGTTMPTRPTRMASPTSTSVTAMASPCHTQAPWRRRKPRARPGACGSDCLGGCWSALVRPGRAWGVDQLAGLVVHRHRDLPKPVAVLARVVSAEEQVTTTGEFDTEVGLSTATVTAVDGCQWARRCYCSGHEASFPSWVSCSR